MSQLLRRVLDVERRIALLAIPAMEERNRRLLQLIRGIDEEGGNPEPPLPPPPSGTGPKFCGVFYDTLKLTSRYGTIDITYDDGEEYWIGDQVVGGFSGWSGVGACNQAATGKFRLQYWFFPPDTEGDPIDLRIFCGPMCVNSSGLYIPRVFAADPPAIDDATKVEFIDIGPNPSLVDSHATDCSVPKVDIQIIARFPDPGILVFPGDPATETEPITVKAP